MNRNIITPRDAEIAKQSAALGASFGGPPPDADNWCQKLLKYIPGEATGLYLVLEGIIKSAFPKSYSTTSVADLPDAFEPPHLELKFWLGATLAIALLFNWLYLRKFWRVQRISQLAISCAALLIYVFAMGGVFAEFAWYKPWQGTALLAISAAFMVFAEPPEAPAP